MHMEYHRVTEVLYPFSGLQFVPSETLDRAATRGTHVHSACEGIMRGLGDWEPPPEIAGYVQSFKLWWGAGKQVSAIEKRFYCKKHAITGQVDAILNMPDGQYIFDIKTSLNPSKTWPLQGSAYAYLARQGGYDIKGILFLKLDREGKIGREYRYEDEWEFYLKTLEVYKRFFAKKPRAKR